MYTDDDQGPLIGLGYGTSSSSSSSGSIARKHLIERMHKFGKSGDVDVSERRGDEEDQTGNPIFGRVNPVSLLKMFVDKTRDRNRGE